MLPVRNGRGRCPPPRSTYASMSSGASPTGLVSFRFGPLAGASPRHRSRPRWHLWSCSPWNGRVESRSRVVGAPSRGPSAPVIARSCASGYLGLVSRAPAAESPASVAYRNAQLDISASVPVSPVFFRSRRAKGQDFWKVMKGEAFSDVRPCRAERAGRTRIGGFAAKTVRDNEACSQARPSRAEIRG